jgi:glycosyltransferase involved in cell wall biosynthesis
MLSWEYPPHVVGGMGKHVMDLVPALALTGDEIHILTPRLSGGAAHEITPEGVHIHRVEPPQIEDYSFVAFATKTNAIMEQAAHALTAEVGGFDLIHAHDWLDAAAGVALKHAWRRPLIATMHATERGRGQGFISHNGHSDQINQIEWWLCYEAWRVITCSHFMANQIHDYFNTPMDKIDVVPNGIYVQPDPFTSEEERRAFRQRFVADDQSLVFFVGRLVYEKGPHVLLDAWPRIHATLPQARLVIAGAGSYLPALKQRAWDMGIADQVTFAGFISDDERDRLYHVADVAVFPSLYEPFGIVALEAMAARCPVVVAATGGLAEVVIPHETGLTVPPNDPAALAWGVQHTLQHPAWTKARVANAARSAADDYNWRALAQATQEVYARTQLAWQLDGWGAEEVLSGIESFHNA